MKQTNLSRMGPVAIVAVLLASLAVSAPAYNANHVAPRSVFLVLPETLPEPEISVTAEQLQSGRWLLRIDATSFQFTELCLSEADAIPVGHAHIIREGTKVASAYHPVVDIGPLPPGRHHISVILRGQDHRPLLGKSGLITTETIITVPDTSAKT